MAESAESNTSEDDPLKVAYGNTDFLDVIRSAKEYLGPARARPRFSGESEQYEVQLPPGKELGRCTDLSLSPVNGDLYVLNYGYGAYTPEDPEKRLNWIVQFDSEGRYVNDFGGDDAVPAIDGVSQWPAATEQVECDAEGNVWVMGFHPSDTVILRFTADGKFIRQYGKRFSRGYNNDTTRTGPVASVYHDVDNRELFVGDGYGNTRVIAFNSDTGEFTRMWGAYGKHPSELTEEESFGVPVHRIIKAPDGLMYVCDRSKNRIQEFELIPGGVRYTREVYIGPQSQTGTTWNVDFTPDNKYMFVADGTAMKVWTVERETFDVLGWTRVVEHQGEDNIGTSLLPLHQIVRLPDGDLLLAGRRKGIQRLKYLGVS